jgi:transcriptional accessory protein Tex/SPT6
LADFHVKHPSEVLKEGEEVEVKIIELKPKAKRISLSLKEASGVMVVTGTTSSGDSADNGNVTLGDVFGGMFDREDYASNEVETEETENIDEVEDVEGGQG